MQMQWRLVEKRVVLPDELPAHGLRAERVHDHSGPGVGGRRSAAKIRSLNLMQI